MSSGIEHVAEHIFQLLDQSWATKHESGLRISCGPYHVFHAIKAGVAADLVRPRRKSGRTKSASGSGLDVAKSRGFSPGYVGLNFLL